jgi:sortase A
MTVVAEPSAPEVVVVEPATPAPQSADTRPPSPPTAPTEGGAPVRWGLLVASWVVITLVGIALVLASMGPLVADRHQAALLTDYRQEIEDASNQAFGLPGIEVPTRAPSVGAAVGILDIGAIDSSRVVVEGSGPAQTCEGPGHVVGTAGPGQPGNSVVVGRASLCGSDFGSLGDLEEGDRILLTTVQGQSAYTVQHVGRHQVTDPDGAVDDEAEAATDETTDEAEIVEDQLDSGTAAADAAAVPEGQVTVDELYGPSDDDRLTLVTSATPKRPWVDDEALVVVATMDTTPFAPTPQGGRTTGNDGRQGDPAVTAPFLLALLAYGAAVAAAVWLFRNVRWRSAYLISLPLLIALTVVLAEQVVRILPAWA